MNKPTSSGTISWGLTDAQVAESRQKHGDNVLTPPRPVSLWKLYMEKYRDPIIQILLVAALVSLVLAFVENDFIETIGIILAVFIATTVGFYFERDAAKKFRVLTAINEDQPVKVRREGRVMEIARRDVVVGDIILIEVGDEIPADGELIEAVNLQVDESSLTGEQLTTKMLPIDEAQTADTEKSSTSDIEEKEAAYPAYVVLRSSMVMNGHAEAVVTHVGDHTEIGKVATSAAEKTDTKTPLNIQLDKLAKLISKVGTAVAIAAFIVFLIHDILTNSLWQGKDYFGMAQVVLNYFMMAVTLIVMAVPEGLPMAVTLALALNMRRMLKSNNLVRKLHASETMGAVTVICTDKTGTLTQNRMTVKECVVGKNIDIRSVYQGIATNTTAFLDKDKGVGNPTEVALLQWMNGRGEDYLLERDSAKIVEQLPFSTENKYMMTQTSNHRLYVKGAPEIVLDMCFIDDEKRNRIMSKVAAFQQAGMRVLLLAMADTDEFRTSDLTFQAVFAIEDPVREDVPKAVSTCRKAGIEVKIVTGDNSATAIEIARQIGIWDEDNADEVSRHKELDTESDEWVAKSERWHITGSDFAALTDEDAYERVEDIRVMSRARPSDKQRLVQLLQKHGEVVAVTGDGTNDAPALNYAHVGLSLGSGTSVAKQASDITLLDDSFHSISSAVMWGRSLYKNIQRFLFFQLVVNLSALLLVLGGAFIGTEMPLTVTQILWVNLIMDTFAAMALASLPPSREVMRDRPRSQSDFIISPPMGWGIIICGLLFFAVMFVFLIWCERHGAGSVVDVHELTIFFTTFVMIQFWNLFNAKCFGSRHSALRYLWRDRGLLLVLVLVFLGQWLIVTFGGRMFRTQPLSLSEWTWVTGITGVIVFGGGEIWRAFKRIGNC
ncbi:MAG: cation-translocating P-type ATPase [Prevotella sp.]|nr:cation-translocating P-type ATPase [Prevotella sp.]